MVTSHPSDDQPLEALPSVVSAWSQLSDVRLPFEGDPRLDVPALFANDMASIRRLLDALVEEVRSVSRHPSSPLYKLAMATHDLAVVSALDPEKTHLDPGVATHETLAEGLGLRAYRESTLGGSIFGKGYADHDRLAKLVSAPLPVLEHDDLTELVESLRPRLLALRSFRRACVQELRRDPHPAMKVDDVLYEWGYLRQGDSTLDLIDFDVVQLPKRHRGPDRTEAIAEDYRRHPTARPHGKPAAQLGYDAATLWTDALALIATTRIVEKVPALSAIEAELTPTAVIDFRIGLAHWVAGISPELSGAPVMREVFEREQSVGKNEILEPGRLEQRLEDLARHGVEAIVLATRHGSQRDPRLDGAVHVSDLSLTQLVTVLRDSLDEHAQLEARLDRQVTSWKPAVKGERPYKTSVPDAEDVDRSLGERYEAISARFPRLLSPTMTSPEFNEAQVLEFAKAMGGHLGRHRLRAIDDQLTRMLLDCRWLRAVSCGDIGSSAARPLVGQLREATDEIVRIARDANDPSMDRDDGFVFRQFERFLDDVVTFDGRRPRPGDRLFRHRLNRAFNSGYAETIREIAGRRDPSGLPEGKVGQLVDSVCGSLTASRRPGDVADRIESALHELFPKGRVTRDAPEPEIDDLVDVIGAYSTRQMQAPSRARIEWAVNVIARRHGLGTPEISSAVEVGSEMLRAADSVAGVPDDVNRHEQDAGQQVDRGWERSSHPDVQDLGSMLRTRRARVAASLLDDAVDRHLTQTGDRSGRLAGNGVGADVDGARLSTGRNRPARRTGPGLALEPSSGRDGDRATSSVGGPSLLATDRVDPRTIDLGPADVLESSTDDVVASNHKACFAPVDETSLDAL